MTCGGSTDLELGLGGRRPGVVATAAAADAGSPGRRMLRVPQVVAFIPTALLTLHTDTQSQRRAGQRTSAALAGSFQLSCLHSPQL